MCAGGMPGIVNPVGSRALTVLPVRLIAVYLLSLLSVMMEPESSVARDPNPVRSSATVLPRLPNSVTQYLFVSSLCIDKRNISSCKRARLSCCFWMLHSDHSRTATVARWRTTVAPVELFTIFTMLNYVSFTQCTYVSFNYVYYLFAH